MEKSKKMDYYDVIQVAMSIMNDTAKHNTMCAVGNIVDKLRDRYSKEVVIISDNPYLLQLNPRCVLKEYDENNIKILIDGGLGVITVLTSMQYFKITKQIRV